MAEHKYLPPPRVTQSVRFQYIIHATTVNSILFSEFNFKSETFTNDLDLDVDQF